VTVKPTAFDVSYRNLGAIIGALLALAAVGILYVAASVPMLESLFFVRTILSGDAVTPEAVVKPLMVGVPPVSAAVGAWLVAPQAIAGDRLSGVAMGAVTYLIAIVVGPILAFHSVADVPSIDILSAAMVSIFAMFLLFPLLLVCVAFGVAWAAALRWLVRATGQRSGIPSPPRLPAAPFIVGFAALAFGWLPLVFLVAGMFTDGAPID
jgi:hypothetical protein